MMMIAMFLYMTDWQCGWNRLGRHQKKCRRIECPLLVDICIAKASRWRVRTSANAHHRLWRKLQCCWCKRIFFYFNFTRSFDTYWNIDVVCLARTIPPALVFIKLFHAITAHRNIKKAKPLIWNNPLLHLSLSTYDRPDLRTGILFTTVVEWA